MKFKGLDSGLKHTLIVIELAIIIAVLLIRG